MLVLANERIEVLERQLNETQIARNVVQEHQEREYSALAKLEENLIQFLHAYAIYASFRMPTPLTMIARFSVQMNVYTSSMMKTLM